MLTVQAQNIKTKNNIADYKYWIYVNNEMINYGIYKGHNRNEGWAALIYNIAKLHLKNPKEM